MVFRVGFGNKRTKCPSVYEPYGLSVVRNRPVNAPITSRTIRTMSGYSAYSGASVRRRCHARFAVVCIVMVLPCLFCSLIRRSSEGNGSFRQAIQKKTQTAKRRVPLPARRFAACANYFCLSPDFSFCSAASAAACSACFFVRPVPWASSTPKRLTAASNVRLCGGPSCAIIS